MKKRTAFFGAIIFILSFSFSKDNVFAVPNIDQNFLAEYRPNPAYIKYKLMEKLFNKGVRAFEKGDYESAIESFSKFIKRYPKSADVKTAYYNRALSKSESENHNGAIADYTKAIEIDPQYFDAIINRSVTREILGDIKGACSDAKKIVSLGFKGIKNNNDLIKTYNDWIKNNCKRFK